MARRISTIQSATSKKLTNPYSQPAFTCYGMNHSHGGGYWSYDHNMNLINSDFGDGSHSYGSFRTHSTGSSQFFEQTSSHSEIQTDNTPSSSSDRAAGTNMIGYLGHQSHARASSRSSIGGWAGSNGNGGRDRRGVGFRDCGVIVNETHQDYAIFGRHAGTSGTYLHCGLRSAHGYYTKMQNGTSGFEILIPPRSPGGRGVYGGICYNPKIKKLLVIESDGSYNHRAVIWNNVPDLRQFAHLGANYAYSGLGDSYSAQTGGRGLLYDYFQTSSNATVYTINNFNTNSYSGADEANWRPVPILNDDLSVNVFTMTPSDGALIYGWNADGTPTGVKKRFSWTTSYGYGHGSGFGSRWTVTSDGKYVAAYCPSYYYQSGAHVGLFRVSDGKYLTFQTNDSTHGRYILPIGKSDMVWGYTHNTDSGRGVLLHTVNIPQEFSIKNNGDEIPLDNYWMDYYFEAGTHSTCYPVIIPAHYDTSLFNDQNLPTLS